MFAEIWWEILLRREVGMYQKEMEGSITCYGDGLLELHKLTDGLLLNYSMERNPS
jgi:hypothetical protein